MEFSRAAMAGLVAVAVVAHWIKLSANEDGSFKVSNGRTGESKRYPAR